MRDIELNKRQEFHRTVSDGFWDLVTVAAIVLTLFLLRDIVTSDSAFVVVPALAICAGYFPIYLKKEERQTRWRDRTRTVLHAAMPLAIGYMVVRFYMALHDTDSRIRPLIDWIGDRTLGLNTDLILNLAQFNDDYKEPFYTAISAAFAILIALALLRGIEGAAKIREGISNELREIQSLSWLIKFFEVDELKESDNKYNKDVFDSAKMRDSPAAKTRFENGLVKYLRHAEIETLSEAEYNDKVLAGLQEDLRNIHPADEDDRIAFQEIMHGLNRITALRERRLTVLGESQPLYMMVSLWVMALALIMPFMAEPLCVAPNAKKESRLESVHVKSAEAPATPAIPAQPRQQVQPTDQIAQPATIASTRPIELASRITCAAELTVNPKRGSQFFMIFLLTSFFSFLLLMLHDVADTRRGFWKVDRRSFRGLRRELDELYNPKT